MNSVHPSTKLKAIGFVNGRPVYPIMGGSGESPESDRPSNSTEDDDDDEDEDDDDSDDASGAGDGQSDKSKKVDNDDSEEPSEADKWKTRAKASDRNNSKLQEKLRKLEDRDKTELQRANDTARDAQAETAKLKGTVSELRLENAFLKTNSITWQNPAAAISIAQAQGYLEGVVEEETGEVEPKLLKAALSKLAKEHEYLVKKQNADQQSPSGEPGPEGGSKNSGDAKKSKKELRDRFPALGR